MGVRIAHLRIAHQVANPEVGNPEGIRINYDDDNDDDGQTLEGVQLGPGTLTLS